MLDILKTYLYTIVAVPVAMFIIYQFIIGILAITVVMLEYDSNNDDRKYIK